METKQLGQSSLKLTRIGLGTWAIGGSGWRYGWGAPDDEDSIRTIQRAVELGINWIDTARVYGLGHSEAVVGRALRGLIRRPLVFTKCGRVWEDGQTIGSNLKKDNIKKEAEESLRRLGIDAIDLYQIHWPMPNIDIEEGWSAIQDLIREGKVRYGGVSNFNIAQLERIRKIAPVTSLQPPYSMLRREIETEILPYCQEHNIGVIGYSPMYMGLLSGQFTSERARNLPDDDHRKGDLHFREPELSINIELAAELAAIAARSNHTAAQLAISWTLRRSEITAAIVGGRQPQQIDEVIKAGDWQLTQAECEEIETLLAKRATDLAALK